MRVEDLFVLAQRILGAVPARKLFDSMVAEQGSSGNLPIPTDAIIVNLERELAGSVGAASAHAMVSRVAGRGSISMTELMDIADETQRLIETSRELSRKSNELTETTHQLREANDRLRQLDARKDDFLSQVSHELRTPMTSIRSFSEILLSDEPVTETERDRFVTVIHEESQRLTRLLNEILDMGQLEAGALDINLESVDAWGVIDASIHSLDGLILKHQVEVKQIKANEPAWIQANEDRIMQVLINLLSNSIKYNTAQTPQIEIRSRLSADSMMIDIVDNGGGLNRDEAATAFEKFIRGRSRHLNQGSGLGLSISRAIARSMGGDLTLEFESDDSSYFRLHLVRVTKP